MVTQRDSLSIENCPNILTVSELCKLLRVSRNTAYRYLRLKRIRFVRVGRQIRIPRDAVIDFLKGDPS